MLPLAIILFAIGGALVIEGAAWAIYPGGLRRIYHEMISQMSDKDLHVSGLICVFIGVIVLALAIGLLPG
ncbi:DUF2065 domain-containing protein [Litorimonas sp. RW-G-Af-16]|uniref:DUF2065 domain-containing protein n=1 Tax=Litorimonas sp. RW-G-Af-16 TaxID=3241168 RepID=UPI00390C78DE